MDAFQVTSLILLSVITIALITLLVIGYKSIVRRDIAAKSLQGSVETVHPRLVEMETALKGYLPALERSAGETTKQLVELAGLLKALDQSLTKLVVYSETQTDLARESKTAMLRSETYSNTLGESLKNMINSTSERITNATRNSGESTKESIGLVVDEIRELRKQLEEVTRF